jgi:hypothetical protein
MEYVFKLYYYIIILMHIHVWFNSREWIYSIYEAHFILFLEIQQYNQNVTLR